MGKLHSVIVDANLHVAKGFAAGDTDSFCIKNAGGNQAFVRDPNDLGFETTNNGTGADTNEAVIYTHTVVANTLKNLGEAIEVDTAGDYGANANTKRVKTKVDGILGVDSFLIANNAGFWLTKIKVFYVTASIGNVYSTFMDDLGNSKVYQKSIALDHTTNYDIVIVGQNGVAVANDVVGNFSKCKKSI